MVSLAVGLVASPSVALPVRLLDTYKLIPLSFPRKPFSLALSPSGVYLAA